MIAIIDYDAGNLRSVEKALEALGQQVIVTKDVETIRQAEKVILPGVGAFGDAMANLQRLGLVEVIRETAASGKPFLGICLGLQLLFEDSDETPGVPGLGILRGHVKRIPEQPGLKVPHMGWNNLELHHDGALFRGLPEHPYVYFVHSYYLEAEDPDIVTATAEYGVTIHASVQSGNLFACQFHQEKSSQIGLAILKNFAELPEKGAQVC